MGSKKALEALAPRHRLAAGLKLRGWKHAQIAAEVGTTEQVISNWMREPLVKAEMERQADNFLETIDQAVAGSVLQAVETAASRVQAPGTVTENGNTIVAPVDEIPVSEADRRAWAFRLFDMVERTRDPRHVPEGPGNGSPGSGGALPSGEGGTTNILQIIGGMTPDQLEAARKRAQEQLGAGAPVEGKAKKT